MEPDGLQSVGLQRVRHKLATKHQQLGPLKAMGEPRIAENGNALFGVSGRGAGGKKDEIS